MRRRPTRLSAPTAIGLTVSATLGLAASSGLAQGPPTSPDEGPIVIGEKHPTYKGFELHRFDASLDLWNQWRSAELKQQGQPTLKESESLYRQTLDLSGEAYIGHKNLIDLTGTAQLGLEEDYFNSDSVGANASTVSGTNLYDIQALVLGNGPVPTTVYGKHEESYTNPDFGGTIKSTTTEYGVIAQARSKVAPTQVQVFHRENDQNDPFGQNNFSYTQDTAILHSELRFTPSQRVLLDYEFDHIKTGNGSGSPSSNDDYDQQSATISHLLTFGALDHNSLRSSLYLEDRSGTFSDSAAHLDEVLFLEHTDRLSSRYSLDLADLKRGDTEQRVARANAIVRHHLFDSLTSTANASGTSLDIPGEFNSSEVTGGGTLDYTKRVPYGILNASVSGSYTHQDNGARGTTVPVTNGVFVFADPFPVIINRRNIIPSSIVVQDAARLRVYTSGVDYTVAAFPDRVEITRIVGGAIANGQAVSIDYDLGPEPSNTIDSTTDSFSIRYGINDGFLRGLDVYAIYRQLDQNASGENGNAFVLDSFNELRYGLEYRIGGASFLGEWVNHDSNITPYDSTRLQAQYDQRFARNSVLSVTGSAEKVKYRITDQEIDLYLATARWSQKVNDNLDISLHADGRLETDNQSPDVHGLDGGLDVTWHRNQTTIYSSIYSSVLDTGPNNTMTETFSIGIKRAF